MAMVALAATSAFGATEEEEAALAAPPPQTEAAPESPTAEPRSTGRGKRDCPPGYGCVTRQKLPRYVSLKGSEARARRGPGSDHKVDWVYQRPGLPMKVTAEYENWRRVEDHEGAGGWMHYALLSTSRTALVTVDMADVLSAPETGSVVARMEMGVVARLHECRVNWCRVSRDGVKGWMPKTSLWGVEPQEVFN